MGTSKRPPWKRAAPKSGRAKTKLTAAWQAKARARAEAAGRRYPNLVDNMWAAAQQAREATASSTK